jgi:hypothetical protein
LILFYKTCGVNSNAELTLAGIATNQRNIIANSCIDISDGLEQDLSHILTCSKVGAGINLEALPLSSEVTQHIANTQDWCVALAGGDDYELCFTAPNAYINRIKAIEKDLDIKLTKIGAITKKKGVKICDKSCSSPSEISIQLLAMPNKDCASATCGSGRLNCLSKALDGVCCFCICCHAKAASPNVLETNIGSPACAPERNKA